MPKATLGLDLGANSIGWALIDEDSCRIIGAGVRVFPEGVDRDQQGGEHPKNEQRRIARGMRRQIARRSRRKRLLRDSLVEGGLLPADCAEQAALDALDPYELRCRALRQPLKIHEIGRVLVHLNQRRGFLSNRKADRARKKENSEMLEEISQLAAEMGERKLGEHFSQLRGATPLLRVRGRHTRRDMYIGEFDAIWAAQQRHHPGLLTDELKYGAVGRLDYPQEPRAMRGDTSALREFGIYGIIFYQRPMYWPKSVVGQCELEPKLKRCPRSHRQAQRFRLLQEVNNIRILDTSSGEERPLASTERLLLIDYLAAGKERTFDAIRKMFCRKAGFPETIRFNLERGDRKKLLGMPTDAALSHKDLFGKAWHDRSEDEKNAIVRILLDDNEKQIHDLAATEWGLSSENVESLLELEFDDGYFNFSLNAIQKLLPHLERGLLLMSGDGTACALSEAGYLRPDQRVVNQKAALPEPPPLTNPLVRQALHEVRKVVNAIIREYGKPECIHIEMAREVKGTAKDRARQSRDMREREELRSQAADEIRKHGLKVSRDAIDRYLLWQEQGRECVYSGKAISQAQLFGGEVDLDHVLPRERSLDNSLMNKVVCFRAENAAKGQRTPHEWLAETNSIKYEAILQRTARLPYGKAGKFRQQSVELDDFIARQLTDTAYITRLVREYVQCLGAEVICSKGQLTAELRRVWGLNTVLRDDGLHLKNRDDHRHHAVDGVVIALTDRSRLQQLARLRRDGHDETMPEPWPNFRANVETAINTINVSHRVRRKVAGALHEETIYGPTRILGEFVYRKVLSSLTMPMIEDIRDPQVKRIVIERLRQHGIEMGNKQKILAEVWKEPLLLRRKPGRLSNRPSVIRKVRLIRREGTILPMRNGTACVKPGSIHHVCVFEFATPREKPTREAVFVSMLEAARRIRDKEPLIQRDHPKEPGSRFIMSLSANEMLLLKHAGCEALYRFDTAASTSQQMWFRHHCAAGSSSEKLGLVSKMPNTLDARKVIVDPIGRIRWAND